jgi:hypothetical protein
MFTHTYIFSHFKKMKLTHIHICRTFRMCESNYVTGKNPKRKSTTQPVHNHDPSEV